MKLANLTAAERKKALARLRDPMYTIPRFGKVKDFKGQEAPADFDVIDPNLRPAVAGFVADADFDNGEETEWWVELKYRQAARSTNYELGGYALAQYRPGWDHVCLHEDTLVLQVDGSVVAIGEVVPGDVVVTHTGAHAKVAKAWRSDKPAYRLKIQSFNQPVICSSDHKHWALWGEQGEMIETERLQPGMRLGFPRRKISADPVDILPYIEVARDRWGNCRRQLFPELPRADRAWGRVVGLYLAEGSIPRADRGGWVAWSVHEDEVERTVEWLTDLGLDREVVKVRRGAGRGAECIVHSTALARWMLALCGKKAQKHLPLGWEVYPREFLHGLVEGYMAGDGHVTAEGRVTSVSISPALTLGIREAVQALVGVWGTVSVKAPRVQGGMQKREAWWLYYTGADGRALAAALGHEVEPGGMKWVSGPLLDDDYVWLTIQAVEELEEVMPMVDIEVDHPDHSFCLPQFATSNCIADTDDRAKYLHQRVHYAHNRWPKDIREPTYSAKERNQLTFDNGSVCRILSAGSAAAGIGQSMDSFHASECGYWTQIDPDLVWGDLYPAMAARPNCKVVFECTATTMRSWWHDFYLAAKRGAENFGRFRFRFTPYFLSRVTRKRWDKTWNLDNEELSLLEKYGKLGLTFEHIAFRRHAMENVPAIKKDPAKFPMYYPFDDVTCWLRAMGRQTFRAGVIDRHLQAVLVPWLASDVGKVKVFKNPNGQRNYVIGVDPCGYAARDHASAHCFCVNPGDEHQAAVVSGHMDPEEMVGTDAAPGPLLRMARMYKALVVVEANGVGETTLALLRAAGYPHIYYRKSGLPGWNNNPKTVDEITGFLQEYLRDKWTISDEDTVEQLASYRHDKRIEMAAGAEQLSIISNRRKSIRRDRHHWDKVSALLGVVVGARSRMWRSLHLPVTQEEEQPEFRRESFSFDDRVTHRKEVATLQGKMEKLQARARRKRKLTRRKHKKPRRA